MKAYKKIIMIAKFYGYPSESDFQLQEDEFDDVLKKGEFVYEAVYISVDPYVRVYSNMRLLKPNDIIGGMQLSRVVASKHDKYPTGCHVVQEAGWRTGGKTDGSLVYFTRQPRDCDLSLGLGSLGMAGITAVYGIENYCGVKSGDVVFITSAAGAVGNIAGQIAKIKGCTVFGICGCNDKAKRLKEIGFDDVLNYKTSTNIENDIRKMAPKGVDCYFDNVGGNLSLAVIKNMKNNGKIAMCGQVSTYNLTEPVKVDIGAIYMDVIVKQLTIKGFVISKHPEVFEKSYKTILEWYQQGILKCDDEIVQGFENLPSTFISLLKGKYFGKVVVEV